MSDITQNIVVTPIDLGVTVNNNQLSLTPEAISLNMYVGGAGGASNSLNADISNVHIYGGTNGYVIQTDGTGNLSWTAQTGGGGGGNGVPGGSNTQVQFNDSGNFGGVAGFTFDSTTGNLNVPNNIIAPNFIGNASYAVVAGYTVYADLATLANSAIVADSANSVAGANVTGAVAYATTANSVAGANVSGQVNYAAVANSVAGANIVGSIPLATQVSGNAQPNITSVGNLISLNSNIITANTIVLNANAIALGYNSNVNTGAGAHGVSIGQSAGAINPGVDAIAIGDGAGGNNQGTAGIAIGVASGREYQLTNAISIGTFAGYQNQGANSIAIGANAGYTSQANNSIILNATGANFNGTTANAFYVNPVRLANTGNMLFYDNTTGEITYNTLGNSLIANSANYANFAGTVLTNAQPNITSVGTLTSLAVTGNLVSANVNSNFYGSGAGLGSLTGANVTGTVANAYYSVNASVAYNVAWYNAIPIGIAANANIANSMSYAIAIGTSSMSTGNGISIGRNAGRNTAGFNPGYNSIVINATGANLDDGQQNNGCFIDPIKNAGTLTSNSKVLFYNTITKEVNSANLNAYIGNINANNANYANFAGNITTAAQPNITSVGTLTSLAVTGNTTFGNIPYIKTPIININPGTSGNYNYDILNGTIQNIGALTGNVIVNLRGNSTVTFANAIPVNTGTEFTFMAYNNIGNTFCLTNIYVDGNDGDISVHGYPTMPAVPSNGTFLCYKVVVTHVALSGVKYEAFVTSFPMIGGL